MENNCQGPLLICSPPSVCPQNLQGSEQIESTGQHLSLQLPRACFQSSECWLGDGENDLEAQKHPKASSQTPPGFKLTLFPFYTNGFPWTLFLFCHPCQNLKDIQVHKLAIFTTKMQMPFNFPLEHSQQKWACLATKLHCILEINSYSLISCSHFPNKWCLLPPAPKTPLAQIHISFRILFPG